MRSTVIPACALALLLAPLAGLAQTAPPVPRPSESTMPAPSWDSAERRAVLPPVRVPDPDMGASLATSIETFVRGYRFEGNTVLSDAELQVLAAPFAGRVVNAMELETLRQLIGARYVELGYINSGAVFPDQNLDDRTVTVTVVEGRLTEVRSRGAARLPQRYVERRVMSGDEPLNIGDLESRLQRLQQDPLIAQLRGELKPGPQPGTGLLLLDVTEARPYAWQFWADNARSPSIGEARAGVAFTHHNLLGRADRLDLGAALTEGLWEANVGYRTPLGAGPTTLVAGYRFNDAEVVEDPFDDLDIESRSQTWLLGAGYRLRDTVSSRVDLEFRLERRKSRNELLGEAFSFSEGADDGVSRVTVLRAQQDLGWQGARNAVGLRSTLSIGVDALGATVNADGIEDGRFVSWLGQVVWARRFLDSGIELLGRSDIQWSDDALLPLEQFSLGGDHSVRGYRQNQLVRDRGVVASLEVRFPLLRSLEARPLLQLAAFADYGRGWNTDRGSSSAVSLAGAGLGLRWNGRRLDAHLYWAAELDEVIEPDDRGLQDRGLHLSLTFRP